jgi:biopolymer transport protein ExbD
MARRSRNRGELGEVPVPLTMMDLAWIVTIITLCAAQFGIGKVRLPQLKPSESVKAGAVGAKGIELAIGADGKLLLQGRSVALEEVSARVKALNSPKSALLLSLETREDGSGHAERLVQLVDRLQRDHLENPLEVRTKLPSTGGTTQAQPSGT